MKKKLILFILTCVYGFAVAAGFLYAKTRSTTTEPATPLAPQQSNWILVRVDDMTSVEPHLVSVWVMLSSFSSPPQVFFKPIFSAELSSSPSSELARKFSVNPDRALDPQFLAELNQLNIQRSGVVILDNQGFQNFTSWFLAPTSNQQTFRDSPALLHSSSSNSEAQSYQHICTVLQNQNQGQPIFLKWNELASAHFMLHPNLDPFAALWDHLLSSATNCKVISEP